MVGIDGIGRDCGGRIEDIPLTYSPSFHFFYFSLFYFLLHFSLPLFFCKYFYFSFSKILQNFKIFLHKIRIWRSCFVEV